MSFQLQDLKSLCCVCMLIVLLSVAFVGAWLYIDATTPFGLPAAAALAAFSGAYAGIIPDLFWSEWTRLERMVLAWTFQLPAGVLALWLASRAIG